MHLVNILVCFLLTTLTFKLGDGESGASVCKTGYFGNECQFKCHCKIGQCNSTGGCTPDHCRQGFFGPACQYIDLLFNEATMNNPAFAQDHDETTCNPNLQQTSVEVRLSNPIILYWVRVHVSNPSVFSHGVPYFTLTLDRNGVCDNKKVYLGTDYIDISCTALMTTKVLLQAKFVGKICSIYFSGGRNVAIHQRTSQSSTYQLDEQKAGADNAVDGSTFNDFEAGESCSKTESEPEGPMWIIAFDVPQMIFTVMIFNEAGESLQFRLLAFNSMGIVVHSFDQDKEATSFSIKVASFPQEPITSITIQQTSNSSNKVLTLCEVMVFAEPICLPGFFGLKCQDACNCLRANACHPATGLCAVQIMKPETLVEHPRNTSECPNGTYGDDCTLKCPETCESNTCDKLTGSCEKCDPNDLGNNCQVCGKDKFGPACSQACPEGCADSCDPKTGNCSKCKVGYKGPKCDKKSLNLLILLIAGIAIGCIAAFVVVTYFLRRERLKRADNESESSQTEEFTDQTAV